MRDALSIMDQAIASAPVDSGKPRLDAGQIRELMGTVANGVFERILTAVHENNSADVITRLTTCSTPATHPRSLPVRPFVIFAPASSPRSPGLTPESDSTTSSSKSPPKNSAAPPAPPPFSPRKSSPASPDHAPHLR